MTTDPLPTHDTIVVCSPMRGIHFIEYVDSEIFMMGWDREAPQPISLYEELDFIEYTSDQKILRPFMLTQNKTYRPPLISPVYFQLSLHMTQFILFPKGYGLAHRDIQIVTRSRRVAYPLLVDRPLASTASREELQIEDGEILH